MAWIFEPIPEIDMLWSRAQCEIGIAGRRRLLDRGCDVRAVHQDVGALPIVPVEGMRWEPAGSGGPRHLVFPVRDDGVLLDLVAWLPSEPPRRLTGRGWCIGSPFLGETIRVARDPLQWLQSPGGALVMLDPSLAWSRLRHAPALVAEDVAHGDELQRLMQPPRWPGQVLVPTTMHARAAA